MKVARTPSWARWLPAAAVALALFGGCGGGVGEGGTGGFAQGAISGFGSVIVNDVHYDVTSTQVLDVDGVAHSSDDLRLGMTVDIDSTAVTSTGAGLVSTATRIRYASEIVGPLAAAPDTANGRISVLGQTVQVSAATVFDDQLSGGLAALSAGQLVAVYAAVDTASGTYKATRIEPRSSATSFSLRGVLAQLNASDKTFGIGAAQFHYGGAGNVPAALANGQFVRVQLQPAAATSTRWTVLSFAAATTVPGDGLQAKVKGLINAFTSVADFSVNGQRVDASGAAFPNGSATLAPGVRVEVEGTVSGGVLRAGKVSIESESDNVSQGFELSGQITAGDAVAQTFVVHSQTVSYAGSVVFKGGTAAKLKVGARVEAQGVLATDGSTVQATQIAFDD